MDSEINEEIEQLFKHEPIVREVEDVNRIAWLEEEEHEPMSFNNFSKLLVISTTKTILIEHRPTRRKRSFIPGFRIEKVIVTGKNEIFIKREDKTWVQLLFQPLNSVKYILEKE